MKKDIDASQTAVSSEHKPSEAPTDGNLPESNLPESRFVSWEKHLEIKRKIFATHDGLMRKLAEHDRQR